MHSLDGKLGDLVATQAAVLEVVGAGLHGLSKSQAEQLLLAHDEDNLKDNEDEELLSV